MLSPFEDCAVIQQAGVENNCDFGKTPFVAAEAVASIGLLNPNRPIKSEPCLSPTPEPPAGQSISTNVTVSAKTSAVQVSATGTVPTYVMGLFGFNSLPIDATASAATNGSTEVAIVFDTTYSMTAQSSNGLSKLANAQADAVQLVQSLMLPGGNPNPNVKVGLVPFGVYVNVENAAVQSLVNQGMSQSAALSALTTTGAPNPLPWLTATQDNRTYATVVNNSYGPETCTPAAWVPATCYNDGLPYDCSYEQYSCNQPAIVSSTPDTEWWGYNWSGCVSTTPNGGDLTDTMTSANPVWGVYNYTCANPMQRLTTDFDVAD